MSTSADSKVLLDARNKSDEIQRRLKGEKVTTVADTPTYVVGTSSVWPGSIRTLPAPLRCSASKRCGTPSAGDAHE